MSILQLPNDNDDTVKEDTLKEETPIINTTELRYTIPSLTNKLYLLNKTDCMKEIQNNRKMNKHLVKGAQLDSNSGSKSKAIPSQYYHKKNVVNDTTANAYRHHTGSHYVMAGGVQFQRGCRVKGVVSRHSRQAAIRNGKKKNSSN